MRVRGYMPRPIGSTGSSRPIVGGILGELPLIRV